MRAEVENLIVRMFKSEAIREKDLIKQVSYLPILNSLHFFIELNEEKANSHEVFHELAENFCEKGFEIFATCVDTDLFNSILEKDKAILLALS